MNDVRHRIIAANGIRLHVAEAGSGPTVLLIHGFPESWYSWRYQLPALAAAGYHAVALDVRGYGRSSKPNTVPDYRMVKKVGDIVGLVGGFGGGPVTVVGHDWGAPIAWMSALLRPDLFRGVAGLSVPYAPPGAADRAEADAAHARDGRRCQRILRRVLPGTGPRRSRDRSRRAAMAARILLVRVRRRSQRPQHFDRAARAAAARQVRLPRNDAALVVAEPISTSTRANSSIPASSARCRVIATSTATGRISPAFADQPITIPALFIGGSRDGPTIWGAPAIERFPQTLPKLFRSEIIDGAGHWIQQEAAQRTNELLIEFLRAIH